MSEIVEVIQPADIVVEVVEQVTEIVEVVERGLRGPQGSSGVVSVTAPVTNTGTSTSAVIGVDQSQFVIAQLQVTNLVSSLSAKANLTGGNTFTGNQTINARLDVKPVSGDTINFRNSAGGLTFWGGNSTYYMNTSFYMTGGSWSQGRFGVDATNPATIGVVVRGAASQSANLQEWQNSAASARAFINSSGDFQAPAIVATYSASVTAGGAAVRPLTVKGAASQTANLQEWQNSAGSVLASVNSSGTLLAQVVQTQSNNARIAEANSGGFLQLKKATASQVPGATDFARLFIVAGTNAGTLKLVVRAGAAGAETTILDNIPQ